MPTFGTNSKKHNYSKRKTYVIGHFLESKRSAFITVTFGTKPPTYGHSKGGPAILFAMTKGKGDINKKSEVLQGTLDLMILKTLHAIGPLHGFGIARRLEQLSEQVLHLNEGTVYTSLLRLQQEGWIAEAWGASENNRKAKFYSITKSGLKQLAKEMEDWERISGVIGRVLRLASQKS